VPIPAAGTHKFGPENSTLSIRTGRRGAAAKAGHDLLIHVTAWEATLEIGDDPSESSIVVDADATSLRVRDGTGGMQELGDDDRASIEETIDDEVLHGLDIEFRSTSVRPDGDGRRLSVQGDLTLVGQTCPIAFDLLVGADGKLSARVVLKQSNWGITPYSALFGALQVADDVVIDAVTQPADSWESGRLRRAARDPVVSSFFWGLIFFIYLWFGMVAIDVSTDTALALALVAWFLIFLFVRARGAGDTDQPR
jgi:polyisoprenoid-binding protein YceI